MHRGRTRPGRLAALDRYLLRFEADRLRAPDPPGLHAVIVDVGLGDAPWTTLELAAAVRTLRPERTVVGTDVDAARLRSAAREAGDRIALRASEGSALPLRSGEVAWVVRAMNVLRGMPEADARALGDRWVAQLYPGGLLVEGSSDTTGAVVCAQLVHRTQDGPVDAGLLLCTDFSRGFAPLLFRDWLPRALRRGVRPGTPTGAFFDAWTEAWREVRRDGTRRPSEAFSASCDAAERAGLPIRWVAEGMALATGLGAQLPGALRDNPASLR